MPPDVLELIEDWKGYRSVADHQLEQARGDNYIRRLAEVMDLLTNARGVPNHRHEYEMREVLTTSDFPLLFGDVLDRQVLASYKAVDPVWKLFTRMSTVKDFRNAYRFAITGGDQYLAEVGQKGEYLASKRSEARYTIAAKKYGRQFDISWETLLNDDLGALRDTPERFARAAVRTEHRLLTNLYADDLGTHGAGNLYDITTAGEINAGVLPLTIANLETSVELMAAFLDVNGEPIMNRAKYLVVPPRLEMTGRQILTSATKMWLAGATTIAAAPDVPYPMNNVIAEYGLKLVVDPYLPVLGTSANSWYLFADPRDIAALEFAHLKGHERPEIVMKASNKVSVGGGAISPFEGDFETDNVLYRVRLCAGVTRLDWRATFINTVA